MRASSVLSLLSLSLPLVLAACGGNDRGGRGYVVVVARDGNNVNEGRDAGEDGSTDNPREDAGDRPNDNDASTEPFDARDEPRPDATEGFPDAWSPEDVGFADAAGFMDASGPPDSGRFDAGRPDTGPSDSGFPDIGFPFPPGDAGRPDTGSNSDSGTPPQFQTTVSMNPGTSQVVLNLIPPVAADPLSFTAELFYDNVGPGSQNISIININVMALIFPVQDFVAGPAHNAPVGSSSRVVNKVAGTGQPVSAPETYCGFPAIVLIDFSNGQSLQDFGSVTCLQ
jgi:hypothetical protein